MKSMLACRLNRILHLLDTTTWRAVVEIGVGRDWQVTGNRSMELPSLSYEPSSHSTASSPGSSPLLLCLRYNPVWEGDAGEMQNFTVSRRKWRSVTLLGILAEVGAVLVASSFIELVMLIPLTGWALLAGGTLWNTTRSLASGNVGLNWDGQRLVIDPLQGKVAVEIEAPTWVFSDRTNIVIRSSHALPKFNSGHVRCNGRELTIDGFLGSAPVGLSDTVQKLGPAKRWLWRYMPI